MLQTHTHQADDEEHVILGTVAPQANDKPAKRTACCRVLKDSRKWQVHEMNPALGLTDVAACSAVRTYACVPSRIPGQMKLGHEASRLAVIIESMCLPTKRLVGHLQETPGLGPIPSSPAGRSDRPPVAQRAHNTRRGPREPTKSTPPMVRRRGGRPQKNGRHQPYGRTRDAASKMQSNIVLDTTHRMPNVICHALQYSRSSIPSRR